MAGHRDEMGWSTTRGRVRSDCWLAACPRNVKAKKSGRTKGPRARNDHISIRILDSGSKAPYKGGFQKP